NFGDALQDLTQKNPAQILRFFFSTGYVIDSLNLKGKIIDALTNEPVENVRFMLYDNLADTVVRTIRPLYVARTDKEGRFEIQNLRGGSFKAFALEDTDANYKFSNYAERIAFPDSFVVLPDTTGLLELKLFQENPPLEIDEIDTTQFGFIKIGMNQKVPVINIAFSDTTLNFLTKIENDTIKLWYPEQLPDSSLIFLNKDTFYLDTIILKPIPKASFLESALLECLTIKRKIPLITQNPANPLRFEWNHPLSSFQEDLILLTEDTVRKETSPSITINQEDPRIQTISYAWRSNLTYTLTLFPGAFTDIYGLSNTDTLIQEYKIGSPKDFGTFDIKFTNLNPDTSYVAELLFRGNLVETIVLEGEQEQQRRLKSLPPGKYELRFITDLNKNGIWDTGNYDLKLQPEPYFIQELEQLRANWEVEVLIDPLASQ
ncbi:MAG: carboxypeptidase-like regulatory domain-containing protein, partial [Bacteroidota bacterium]